MGFFSGSERERERGEGIASLCAHHTAVQAVNEVRPEAQFDKAKPSDSAGLTLFIFDG